VRFKSYSSEGVVLARRNFSEADRILIIFSKDFGKLSLLAKGVRKLKSRKRGAIEVFSRIKFQGVETHGIDLITEAEVVDSFPKLRIDLKKAAVSYNLMEAVGKLTQEGEKHLDVYNLLIESLSEIEKEKNLKEIREDFIKEVLVNLGFWPRDKKMDDVDRTLETVSERKVNSIRVGKKLLS
jgi:DNA repair protein RecO (recombination protein O)